MSFLILALSFFSALDCSPKWRRVIVSCHIFVIHVTSEESLSHWSACEIQRHTIKLASKLSADQKQRLAIRFGAILILNKSDKTKLPICWAIAALGPDAKPALGGLNAYLVELKRRPVPRIPDESRRKKAEFVEAIISKMNKK